LSALCHPDELMDKFTTYFDVCQVGPREDTRRSVLSGYTGYIHSQKVHHSHIGMWSGAWSSRTQCFFPWVQPSSDSSPKPQVELESQLEAISLDAHHLF
jgi:hypothetical protein